MEEFIYNVKCIVEYDGSSYMGFQKQKDLPTVEYYLTKALRVITKEQTKIIGSGRTDRGVHALGQVFNFHTNIKIDEKRFLNAFNRMLPKNIHIKNLNYVDSNFHSRFSAQKKEYRYYIKYQNYSVFDTNYAFYHPNLDLEKMKGAIKLFEGKHQFQGFCSMEVDKRKDFNKTIYEASIHVKKDYYEFVFIGSGFLKYQIRRMMGLLIAIGEKKEPMELIQKILETHDPEVFTKVAEPNGLYLVNVTY